MIILVSGASGLVGYGILKSLKGYKLIGTTIYDFSVAPAFCDVTKTILPTDDYFYIDNLCDIIEDYHVDMIIPSIECDVLKWNENREILSEITFPLLNNSELIQLCSDKWSFYQKLVAECPKYAIPTTLGNDFNPYTYPFLLKPRTSYGSKGIVRINSGEEYEFYRSPLNWKHLIVQPIIGSDNEEYTVSGFFDLNSNLIDYFPLRRKLLNGSTNEATVEDRNFGEALTELGKVFKPVGPTNFQFRFDGDSPKLLEINPRISSATSIRTAFGYNESQMSVDYFLEGITPKVFNKPIGRKAIRYIENYIF